MAIEKSENKFGLVAEAEAVLGRAKRNIRVAASTIYNLRVAAETGVVGLIEPTRLVAMLKEAEEALNAVTM